MADIQKLNVNSTTYDISVPWGKVTGKPSTFAPSLHTHTYIKDKDNYSFTSSNLPTSFDQGISCGFVQADPVFPSYGSVLTVRTYSGGGGSLQLYAPYSNTYGGSRLRARFGNYDSNSGNSWTTLKEIAWLSDIPTSLPASDVYSWAKASSKPTYTYSEVGAAPASHTHSYLPLTGGSISGSNVIGMSSAGLPTIGGSNIATKSMAIGVNGIGISGTDTRNDGAAIFLENNGTEANRLIIALGDDSTQNGSQDYTAFRYYDTAGAVTYESKIPFKSGTLAIHGDPQPASDVYAWAKAASKPTYTYSEVGAAPASHNHDYTNFYKSGCAYPYGRSDKVWHKVASFTQSVANTQINTGITFYIGEFYLSRTYGILNIQIRNESGTVNPEFCHVVWSLNNGIDTNEFVVGHSYSGNTVTYNLYVKRTGWSSYNIRKIAEQAWGSDQNAWECHYATNGNANCYVSIPETNQYISSNLTISNTTNWSSINGKPNSMPASDVYSWAKASSKPTYTYSEVGAAPASHTHNYLPLSGGTMSGTPYINMPASAATISDNQPFGITYGRIQAYGTMTIAADTDGSTTEFVNITAGYGVSNATAANGLSIGYNTLKWKGSNISIEGHTHSQYLTSLPNHTHSYLPLSGGTLTGVLKCAANGLVVNSDGGDTAIRVLKAYGSGASNSGAYYINFGNNPATSNCCELTFNYVGSGSSSNYSGIGFYGGVYFKIFANGNSVNPGTMTASGFYQSSDERLKTFYDPIKVDLEKLKTLRKNYFKFNDKDELEIGVSAQEIQSLYPEIVSENDEGYLSVAYDKLSVIALSAIDKLDDDIKELKQENKDLKDQLKSIKDQLKTIKNILKEEGIL